MFVPSEFSTIYTICLHLPGTGEPRVLLFCILYVIDMSKIQYADLSGYFVLRGQRSNDRTTRKMSRAHGSYIAQKRNPDIIPGILGSPTRMRNDPLFPDFLVLDDFLGRIQDLSPTTRRSSTVPQMIGRFERSELKMHKTGFQ